MAEIWSELPPEVKERIVALTGKKKLFIDVFGIYPKSCAKILESARLKQILHDEKVLLPCSDFLNDDWSFNIDFCVALFRASFYQAKWNILFNVIISCGVFYSDELSILAKRVSKELEIIRIYVNEEMTCYWIEADFFDFKIDFENHDEFVKFYVFFELYGHISIDFFDEIFFERIMITSYEDFYEFLPGRGNIESKLTRYFENSFQYCEIFPKLSALMRSLSFKDSCPTCKEYKIKWQEYTYENSAFFFFSYEDLIII